MSSDGDAFARRYEFNGNSRLPHFADLLTGAVLLASDVAKCRPAFRERRNVRVRRGERRSHVRFEIVGTLVGFFDYWKEFGVCEIGPRGALVQMSDNPPLNSQLSGRMYIGTHGYDVLAEVRHVAALHPESPQRGYRVGLELVDMQPGLARELQEAASQLPVLPADRERRETARYRSSGHGHFQIPLWATVELQDISLGGTMFTTDVPFEGGSRGQLRTRLGDRSFSAEIKVLWTVPPGVASTEPFRVGACFMAVDVQSREALTTALAASGN
jgi:hypothetical protein